MESSHEGQPPHGGDKPLTDVLPESSIESTPLKQQEPDKSIAGAHSETTIADVQQEPAHEHPEQQSAGAQLKTPVADAEPAEEHGGAGAGQHISIADIQPTQKDKDVGAEQPIPMADVEPGQAHGDFGAGQHKATADVEPVQIHEDAGAEQPIPMTDVQQPQAHEDTGAEQQMLIGTNLEVDVGSMTLAYIRTLIVCA